MTLTLDEARRQLQAAGRYMLANTLTWGNAGNLSVRTGEGAYLITASGTRLGELADDDFVECPLQPDADHTYPRKPSKEMPMHRAIYQQRPEINAVLHGSPLYTTLVACSDLALPSDWFVEDMYYLERVARVPYFHPGSQALGDAVAGQARQANILLLDNHGVLVCDTSVSEALNGLHTLETVCQMLIAAPSAGVNMRSLPADTVNDFLQNAGYKPPRKWPT